jgi:hypothetical protein
MSRKLFGKITALLAISLALAGCTEKIVGNPEAVVERYIKAIQTDDFNTIYTINSKTAWELRYQAVKDTTFSKEELAQAREKEKAMYAAAPPSFIPGQRWAERHFFPPSSSVTVEKAHWLPPFGTDNVNAEYEKAATVIVPLSVVYSSKEAAPEYQEGRVKSAKYECTLVKIRLEGAVAIYSHDTQWYVSGFIVDRDSITLF